MVGAVASSAAAAGGPPERPHGVVYISAVQHDWQGRDGRSHRSLNTQWVDITNSSRRAVNLDSWTLSDREGHTFTFHHARLAGRATVRVHTGVGRNTGTDLYQDRRTRVWDADADSATLRDARGHLVDAVSWDRGGEEAGRRDGAGRHHGDEHHHGGTHDRGGMHRHGGMNHLGGAHPRHDGHAGGHHR
ncbi:hypothetical protein AQI95_04640 [Streptomyces yokosukanensis]|uniref:LTD domain-containing protein n=1 Tax=Streptomyces yokosukanensis TaxID=67386 RepID=A0A101PDD3_9ACTN|nr:hypothetical protein AQI95_04640 [Streptomyces yokosukanensis]